MPQDATLYALPRVWQTEIRKLRREAAHPVPTTGNTTQLAAARLRVAELMMDNADLKAGLLPAEVV